VIQLGGVFWTKFEHSLSKTPTKEASPTVLLVQSRAKQKNALFLLPARRSLGAGGEERIGGARKNQKSGRKFC